MFPASKATALRARAVVLMMSANVLNIKIRV